jgi:hypothetical protein
MQSGLSLFLSRIVFLSAAVSQGERWTSRTGNPVGKRSSTSSAQLNPRDNAKITGLPFLRLKVSSCLRPRCNPPLPRL